jgi:hypothetical protein
MTRGFFRQESVHTIALFNKSDNEPYTGTLANGDFRVTIDGGPAVNATSLPEKVNNTRNLWRFTLSAAQSNGKEATIEWESDDLAFDGLVVNLSADDEIRRGRATASAAATDTTITVDYAGRNDADDLSGFYMFVYRPLDAGFGKFVVQSQSGAEMGLNKELGFEVSPAQRIVLLPASATDPLPAELTAAGIQALLTTQIAESYPANGELPQVGQALLSLFQRMFDVELVGGQLRVKTIDGTGTAIARNVDNENDVRDVSLP